MMTPIPLLVLYIVKFIYAKRCGKTQDEKQVKHQEKNTKEKPRDSKIVSQLQGDQGL